METNVAKTSLQVTLRQGKWWKHSSGKSFSGNSHVLKDWLCLPSICVGEEKKQEAKNKTTTSHLRSMPQEVSVMFPSTTSACLFGFFSEGLSERWLSGEQRGTAETPFKWTGKWKHSNRKTNCWEILANGPSQDNTWFNLKKNNKLIQLASVLFFSFLCVVFSLFSSNIS